MRKLLIVMAILVAVCGVMLVGPACEPTAEPRPFPPPTTTPTTPPTTPPTTTPTTTPPPAPPEPEPPVVVPPAEIPQWESSDLKYKVTEKNQVWWKFAWQVTLKNNTAYKIQFFVDVYFLDEDGFIIDDDIEALTIPPGGTAIVRGAALIDTEIAPLVDSMEGSVTGYVQD